MATVGGASQQIASPSESHLLSSQSATAFPQVKGGMGGCPKFSRLLLQPDPSRVLVGNSPQLPLFTCQQLSSHPHWTCRLYVSCGPKGIELIGQEICRIGGKFRTFELKIGSCLLRSVDSSSTEALPLSRETGGTPTTTSLLLWSAAGSHCHRLRHRP